MEEDEKNDEHGDECEEHPFENVDRVIDWDMVRSLHTRVLEGGLTLVHALVDAVPRVAGLDSHQDEFLE